MRTGACTLPQALSAEAAAVLKHSLALARRRGHAHVTPLHVAATLLSSSSTAASALLRRACLKSQPNPHPASHPLRCRALELCFNVALNRLPTATPPPSSAPLLGTQAHPSLSNALIAALKRAQAHQRRGCIELQQQQPLSPTKVELEQLIISILDDPSVSRVMREAGFSSTCVKNNLEDSSPFPLEPHRHFPKKASSVPQSEDLSAVLEAMLRKPGRRANIVVVGDSVSGTEGIVAELIARVERGEVPDELKAAHVVRLHLSYVHLRLMSRSDVDVKVSDLRRKIASLGSDCVIICAGDLRWAVDEETKDGCRFEPVGHMVAELGRLLSELRSSISKVWLLATASYQTYVRCQMRQPSLETQWALQAVVVPSGGLALNLQAPSGIDSRLTKLFDYYPFRLLGDKSLTIEDDEKLICCAECTSNFEKEASFFSSWTEDTNCGSTQLPCWLQQRLNPDNRKDDLQKLKRKWNSLCKNIHHSSHGYPHFLNQSNSIGKSRSSTCSSSNPGWSSCNQICKSLLQPNPLSLTETTGKLDRGFPFCNSQKLRPSEVNLHSLKTPGNDDKGVTLSLGSAIASDLLTPIEHKDLMIKQHELAQKLQEKIPWQSEIIPSIVDAISRKCKPSESKGIRILLQGSDYISKRRLAELLLQYFGATDDDRIMRINMASKSSLSCCEIVKEAMEHEPKHLVLIEDIDLADAQSIRSLIDILKLEAFVSSTFIISTLNSASLEDNVIKIKIMLEDQEPTSNGDVKRKQETAVQSKSKRPKTGDCNLDLNLLVEDEGEGIPHLTPELLELVTAQFTLDADPERSNIDPEKLILKLRSVFEETRSSGSEGGGQLLIDEAAADELAIAVSSLRESIFERWVREVFQTFIQTLKIGGNVRLCVEGKEETIRQFGFMGSVLPKRIHVE